MHKLDLSIGETKLTNKQLQSINSNINYFDSYPHEIKANKIKILHILKKNLLIKHINTSNLCFTLGNREGLYSSFTAILHPQKKYVILLIPYYQIYKKLAILTKKKIIFIKQTQVLTQLKRLNTKILKQINCIFICNPNNFNGNTFNKQQLLKLITILKKYNIFTIYDNCYSEITNNSINICSLTNKTKYKNLIHLLSVSKRSCAPGLRAGILIAKNSLITKINHFKLITGTHLSCRNQILNTILWQNNSIKNYLITKTNKLKIYCKKIAYKYKLPISSNGFYLTINTATPQTTHRIINKLNINNIKVCTSEIFGIKNHIRVALIAKIATCKTAIKTIAKIITHEKYKNIKKNNKKPRQR
ncbi:pyridoxal phosphate-dependent aminotransferase [Candidatus Vidania fulgoroideae]|uniref:Pyridoxal phosphate-dependent aminotransferase n=1 Tax=Candidatus Vidania fulgoroideorum TaxID=881286 RepID=A0A974X733_9PROT|nr:pyridoxal phosphate-dependent aminotransferase [Candidatus Vidania fulgoroideae]